MLDGKSAGTGPVCYWHHGLPAVARCVYCGKNICADCAVLLQNRNYCRACTSNFVPPQYPPYSQSQACLACPVPAEKKWYDFLRRKGPPVFPGARWGLWEAVLIYLFANILAFGAAILLAVPFGGMDNPTHLILVMFLSSVFLYTAFAAGIFVSVEVVHKSSLSEIGLSAKGIGKSLALGLGFGLPLYAGAVMLAYVTQLLVKPHETDITRSLGEVSEGGVNPWLVVLLIFTIVVLAPIFEEMFFRGYLYPALRNRMGMQPAMLLDGALFAAAHFEIFGFLPRMLLGYGLSYIFEKNKNLAGPILGHALYNGIMMALWLLASFFL
ncbi:MAG: CPBP family intramembrane metalloprotease [Actinobacteria bacterium]|nr:CPBP family intramembrane metalloprotease [Actinomycetota bacterium]